MARDVHPLESVAREAAAVAAAWAAMAAVEPVVVMLFWGKEFAGAWEMAQVRRVVAPLAVAALGPASLTVVGWWRVALRARDGARLAQLALASLGGVAAGLVALGVTTGRHFASWGVRGPFVVACVVVGATFGLKVIPRVAVLERRPGWLASLGGALLVTAWLADALVLPRLYPAFHSAMLVSALLGGALLGLGLRVSWERPRWLARAVSLLVAAVVAGCMALTPACARALAGLNNLRIILVEHAPILGPVVEATMASRPPEEPSLATATASVAPGEIARSLDWTGHDIVLLTVDALRADHVSAYGYSRPTTPHLDAVASRGALFAAAYCPTPHTSYSITSMMTGKYLRPLLSLGLGADSETWAQDLRRYGWRTAAFYPPAVFFIDEARFPHFEETHLGFEYAKVEFADPGLREQQVAGYLDGAPRDVPLFLWVHFFEPHEPYVAHADHVFGGGAGDEDAYDSEIATADDGIGRIVALVEARRPGAVVIVTADHGEEFGDHGGRYHGTTVYEEQVRVPLVVAGPGVRPGARIDSVVQTIDLLPTALSALGIPRPARLRGRDLGPALAGTAPPAEAGFAFAETDDYALVAEGPYRLVCERRAAACALHDLGTDPGERRDVGPAMPAKLEELRATMRAVERDHGRFEAGGPVLPDALRRGMQGETDAALDVAALLDDADVQVRRQAAKVSFGLHATAAAPELRRAAARDEDDEVHRWAALALARIEGQPVLPLVPAMLKDPSREWSRSAALALGERGDGKACDAIAAWWSDILPPAGQGTAEGEPPRLTQDLPATEQLLVATTRARCRSAVPSLTRALVDVRARPYVADALGSLGDERARGPLGAFLFVEPYVTTRPHEARALLALGAHDWVPRAGPAPADARAVLEHVPAGPLRVAVLLTEPQTAFQATADDVDVPVTGRPGEPVRYLEIPGHGHATGLRLGLHASTGGIEAIWVGRLGPLD